MAKPQNNRERLLLIRKGLERILDEYRGERKRWLDTLGDSSDLPTLRFDTKIKAVDNLLTELATVLYTLCREEGEGEGSQETRKLRSEETAKGAEEDRGGVPRIEYVKPTVTEGKRTGEKCKITDPDNGSVDREGNFVCVSEETADAMNRARLRELMELPNAHPSVAEKLGKWFASQKGKGRNRLVIVGGRWEVLERTTPSGKTLFRCKVCLRESVGPDKECPTMDCEGIEKRMLGEDTREREIEEGTTAGGELLCWARGVGCPPIPCRLIPGQCGIVRVNETGEVMREFPGRVIQGEEKAREWFEGVMGGDGNPCIGCPGTSGFECGGGCRLERDRDACEPYQAWLRRGEFVEDTLARQARGEYLPPLPLEDTIRLGGEEVKDRIAETEAQAILRLGAAENARKHTAEDIAGLKSFVKKALEVHFSKREILFADLGLIPLGEAVDLTELRVIQIAYQKAHETGKEKLAELIAGIERLWNEQNKK